MQIRKLGMELKVQQVFFAIHYDMILKPEVKPQNRHVQLVNSIISLKISRCNSFFLCYSPSLPAKMQQPIEAAAVIL